MMLGAIDCKSPDPLTCLRVGRYELWHRDFRRVLATLDAADIKLIREYLHYTKTDVQRGQTVELPVVFNDRSHEIDTFDAFARLWRALVQAKVLRPPTEWSHDASEETFEPTAAD